MSHQPEREEKICLNCGSALHGRYCHICGQENIVTHQSFWSLSKHFVYDIFHFDGRFFDTLKYMLIRPGFVPKEYLKGRRQSFLDPIRMYLFTSAVFFLVFFAIKEPSVVGTLGDNSNLTRQERYEYAGRLMEQLQKKPDSSLRRQLSFLLDTSYHIKLSTDSGARDSMYAFPVQIRDKKYIALPRKEISILPRSDLGWLDKRLKKGFREMRSKYGEDDKAVYNAVATSFMHKFPYLLFISLPFFALILKLLYVRRRQFFYNDHAVFTLYHYIFMFILLLIYFLFEYLSKITGAGIFGTISTLLLIGSLLYLYLSMKRFYGQSWGKTLLKFLLLDFIGLILMLILVIFFMAFSFFQI